MLAADRVRRAPAPQSPHGANTRRPYAAGRRTSRRGWPAGSTPSRPGARSPEAHRPAPFPRGAGRSRFARGVGDGPWSSQPAKRRAVHHPRRLGDPRARRRADRQRANQSLAQATVPPGARTEAHYHRASEEIYLFTAGAGRMILAGEESPVRAGDCVVIPPGRRAPARQRRRRAARAALLLLTALLARGHGDHSSSRARLEVDLRHRRERLRDRAVLLRGLGRPAGTSPRRRRARGRRSRASIFLMAKPSPSLRICTSASVWTDSALWPPRLQHRANCIEKQLAWAAAMSSSGLVAPPSPSS